jgi:energy-coupling factor transport system ATP-binding protein
MPSSQTPLMSLRGWSLDRHTPQGTTTVLHDIDLDLLPGRWLAILGANGSGKSSLLKYLAAEDSPVADGAAIVFQDPDEQIFATSVDREITLGRATRDADAVRAEFGLADLGEMNPRLLSAGEKQRLVLAVALGDRPRVLLCDEPTSLQDPVQAVWVLDRLDRWRRDTGGALVTATCDRREATRADDLLVLAEGRVLARGPAATLLADPRVTELLGPADPPEPQPAAGPVAAADPILTLQDVGCDFPVRGGFSRVDLTVRPGERWGLIGPNGCGKSTLLALCAGARRPERGTVTLAGRLLYRAAAIDLDHGQALLAPQFPEYLFTRSTVRAEIALDPVLNHEPSAAWLQALGLAPDLATRNPHELSSGQRRRLALGLVLRSGRPVLLLDEPTAALDQRGKTRILDLLAQLPASSAVLIASHDRGFLAQAGCRILQVTSAGLVSA